MLAVFIVAAGLITFFVGLSAGNVLGAAIGGVVFVAGITFARGGNG